MSRITILIVLLFFSGAFLFAQTPEKMSYQAVVRYNDNSLVMEANVGLKILIRKANPDGTIMFEETHDVLTNRNGLASIEIGTGSSAGSGFGSIDWSQGPYFIETRIDPNGGSNYSVRGTSEILSVPYALQAKTANILNGTIIESQISNLDHYSDMDINGEEVAFSGWDKDASNDFSGNYTDLEEIPSLYTTVQVDSILLANRTEAKNYIQSLSLEDKKLIISGGNSISLESWDADDSDDFSGDYNALFNIPKLYTKDQVDSLLVVNAGGEGIIQNLELNDNELQISGGNSITFENWDSNVNDDFDGEYASLKNMPEIYTKSEIDSIRTALVDSLSSLFYKKSNIIPLTSSRSIGQSDIGNTIACTASSTLTLTKNFNQMEVGDIINLEAHNGADLTVKAVSGVKINYVEGFDAKFDSDPGTVHFGLLRKQGENEYIISGQ
ncbi:MAG TPA: hypothetical protein ENH91_14025 [Leeuwenhoekiella sp.]|nr:hypothetical protein [Leeuwenhoekiella sp.]